MSAEERACLERYDSGRELPPEVDAKTPPEISDQPMLRSIRIWNDEVIAIGWRLGHVAYRVDDENARLIPLRIPGCPEILDLAENRHQLFALCAKGEDLFVAARAKGDHGAWETAADLPEDDFRPHGPLARQTKEPWGRVTASDGAAVVAGSLAYWWSSAGGTEWRRHPFAFEDPPKVHDSRLAPNLAFVTAGALFLSWDFGEFGSAFYRLAVDPSGSPIGDPERILMAPAHSIAEDSQGSLWIAGGGAGMVGAIGQVVAFDGSTSRPVLYENAAQCEPSDGLRLPQSAGIEGLTLDVDGTPLILAGDLGIFRIENAELIPIIEARMTLKYVKSGAYSSSAPVGLVATERGIFVASRSLGVFVFSAEDDYTFTQIVIE